MWYYVDCIGWVDRSLVENLRGREKGYMYISVSQEHHTKTNTKTDTKTKTKYRKSIHVAYFRKSEGAKISNMAFVHFVVQDSRDSHLSQYPKS